MKDSILFITCSFNKISANSLCVKNIADEFVRRGYHVFILCDLMDPQHEIEEADNITVVRLKSPFIMSYKKSQSRLERIRYRLFALFTFPDVHPFHTIKVYRNAAKIITKNKIRIVMGTYQTSSSLIALLKLKKKFKKQITAYGYHIDQLIGNKNTDLLSRYKRLKQAFIIKKENKVLDFMLVSDNDHSKYSDSKTIRVNLPVYVPNCDLYETDFHFSASTINISYIGSLDSENRNPKMLFELLNRVITINNKKITVHLWGNISKSLLDVDCNNINILYHGYIDESLVVDTLKKSDFVVNICNKVFYEMIPSKIFKMFVANTPIINFVQSRDDITIPFFEGNKNIINIYNDDESLTKLEYFINGAMGMSLDYDLSLLAKNTPQYFVDNMRLGNDNYY